MFDSLLSGAVFGAALAATGMYQPSVIVSQMKLENWHMVQTFLTGSAASTSARVHSGLYTLGGSVLGGIIWSGFLRSALASLKSKSPQVPPKPEDLTIYGALGTSQTVAFIGVEVMFAGAVAAISALRLVKTQGLVGPVLGGFLVAGAQLFSALIRKTLLGTSASFEEFGDYISWLLRGGGGGKPKSYNSIAVVTGMIVGALGLSLATPLPQIPPSVNIETTRLVTGGILLTLGARMGGGCTSGHGITGISLLSVSSFVSVAAMFAGAFGTAALI
ncbi:hypothetical protein E0Z10_g991 [Xylaria hypoxylon]|uniref:Uncharacterized protein n=1 Tax=Xylaria hypoxylon TaxID=37992 RepID=A0A4Z0Z7Q1_9PEZI|nr:hypothetical protein E0Z10_g991 [Xylaria hypoxylon]